MLAHNGTPTWPPIGSGHMHYPISASMESSFDNQGGHPCLQ